MSYPSLPWNEVKVGSALPCFTYELNLLRTLAFVRATGLYDYIHFDEPYAKAAGARAPFLATPHVAGLFSRLLTDWSGPSATVRSLSFSIRTQSYLNDTLKLAGKIARKYVDGAGCRIVEIDNMQIVSSATGLAATAKAVVQFCEDDGTIPRDIERSTNYRTVTPDPNMPDFAKAAIGSVHSGLGEPEWPLTKEEIHLWCECMEDWNPLYWDEDYARQAMHGGIIAPASSFFFGTGSSARWGIGYLKPGQHIPAPVATGASGLTLLQDLRRDMVPLLTPFSIEGYPEIAVLQYHNEYFAPLKPGDTTTTKSTMLNCSAKKDTKLGEGYFVTWLSETRNQTGEVIKEVAKTVLFYRPRPFSMSGDIKLVG
jgi:acyl dehydratase